MSTIYICRNHYYFYIRILQELQVIYCRHIYEKLNSPTCSIIVWIPKYFCSDTNVKFFQNIGWSTIFFCNDATSTSIIQVIYPISFLSWMTTHLRPKFLESDSDKCNEMKWKNKLSCTDFEINCRYFCRTARVSDIYSMLNAPFQFSFITLFLSITWSTTF